MSAPHRAPTHRADGSAQYFRNARLAPKVAAATGGAVLVAGLSVAGGGAAIADNGVWDKVAKCESGGNWSIATGNGYYGGLQFSKSTWKAFGGTKYAATANKASKAQQIAVAQRTLAKQGPGAWPVCGKRAGLTKASGGADANAQLLGDAVLQLRAPRLSGSGLQYDAVLLSGSIPATAGACVLFLGPGDARPG